MKFTLLNNAIQRLSQLFRHMKRDKMIQLSRKQIKNIRNIQRRENAIV